MNADDGRSPISHLENFKLDERVSPISHREKFEAWDGHDPTWSVSWHSGSVRRLDLPEKRS